jgi:hypothetical protein
MKIEYGKFYLGIYFFVFLMIMCLAILGAAGVIKLNRTVNTMHDKLSDDDPTTFRFMEKILIVSNKEGIKVYDASKEHMPLVITIPAKPVDKED